MSTKITCRPEKSGWLSTILMGLVVATLSPAVTIAQETPSAVGPLLKLYQSGRLPAERQAAVVEMICNRGNEHDLRVVFDKVVQPEGMTPPLRLQALGWLTEAARTRKVKPAGDLQPLEKLVSSKEAPVRLAAIKLAATYKAEAISPALRKLVADPQSPPDLQQVAISGLVAIGGAENQQALVQLAEGKSAIPLRMLAVAGLVGLDLPVAAKLGATALSQATPDDDPATMLDAFFNRKDGSDQLASELKQHKLTVDVAKRSLRYMYSVGRSDAALSNVLSEAAGIAADPPPPTQEQVAELVQEVIQKGDPARGEKIFRRADLSCMKCHSVSRAGGIVGPELSPVGGSSPLDYIVNSVLNPNLAVKEQYVTRVFALADGTVASGVIIDRDENRVRIRDSQARTIIIPTADIDEEVEGQSPMPAGLTKFLTHQELLDLIKFVSELGKPGPYAVRTVPSIQRWQRLKEAPPELTADVPHLEHIRQSVLGAPPEAWTSAYGMVRGTLPLEEFRRNGQPEVVILRGELQVNTAGSLSFALTSTETTQLWFDAEAFLDKQTGTVMLEPGLHQVTVRVEISDRPGPELKLEFQKPADSPIQFEVIGGP